MRLAGALVFHLLDVAVVGGDQGFAANLVEGRDNASDAGVQAFHRGHGGAEHPGVADHVAVGVVDDDHVITLLLNGFDDAVGDDRCVHLRLQVVGGDVRRRDQDALFALERLFAAAGEEEGDVGVFLGFGDAQLGLALLGQVFAEHVGQRLRFEGAGGLDARRVLGKRDEAGQLRLALAREFGKVAFDKGAAELAGTVGAEVHEDHGIAIFDLDRLADGGGFDELVAFFTGIGRLQAFERGGGVELALAFDDQVVGLLDTVPAIVAVHGEVATAEAGDAALA